MAGGEASLSFFCFCLCFRWARWAALVKRARACGRGGKNRRGGMREPLRLRGGEYRPHCPSAPKQNVPLRSCRRPRRTGGTNERHFHAFYALPCGADAAALADLELREAGAAARAAMAARERRRDGPRAEDAERWRDMQAAIESVEELAKHRRDINRTLAAVEHLRSVQFVDANAGGSAVDPASVARLESCERLLGLPVPCAAFRDLMLKRAFLDGVRECAADAAHALCLALARQLYSHL